MSRAKECKRIVETTLPEVYAPRRRQTIKSSRFEPFFVSTPCAGKVELAARVSKDNRETAEHEIDMLSQATLKFLGALADKGIGQMASFGGLDWMFRERQLMTKWQKVLSTQRLAMYESRFTAECKKLPTFPPP